MRWDFCSKRRACPAKDKDESWTELSRDKTDVAWINRHDSPIIVLDDKSRVVGWNDTMARATQMPTEETLYRDFATLVDDPEPLPSTFSTEVTIRFSIQSTLFEGKIRRQRGIESNHSLWICFLDVIRGPSHSEEDALVVDDTFECADIPIFEINLDMKITKWNREIAELLSTDYQYAIGRDLYSFVDSSHHENLKNCIATVHQNERTQSLELEMKIRNESRSLLVSASAKRDIGQKAITGVRFFAFPYTECQRDKAAIASIADEFQRLITSANAPIFGIDCDGDINEWNEKAEEITGYSKDDVFDQNFVRAFVVESMQEGIFHILQSGIQGQSSSNVGMDILSRSGTIRHLLVNITVRRDANKEIVGLLCMAQDITEVVKREQAITIMAKELRQLIETANAPIFGIDRSGCVNEWNEKTQRITGYTKSEAIGKHFTSFFIAPSFRPMVDRVLSEALKGTDTSNYEIELLTRTGDPIFVMINATARCDLDNNIVGVVGVGQDITEEKKGSLILALLREQDAKVETERAMTAYFAHELRNPLHAIDSAILAMPEEHLSQEARELVAGMQLCTSFMSSVMNNLLDVRKMEEKKLILHLSPESLSEILTTVHKMLAPGVRTGVRFQKDCQTLGRDWVLCDKHRMLQILTNVVTNAIKYTTSGSIRLVCRWESNNVVFKCEDTGPGIPKSEQQLLFHRFVKRGSGPGTGLGLAIAKHLVELNHGEIFFESDPRVRPGTTCVIKLPLKLSECPHNATRTEKKVSKLIEEPLRFLIIDDIKLNRSMLNKRIKKCVAPNAAISEASTGEEAIELCKSQVFEFIIVDQYMEEAGGIMLGTDFVYALRRLGIRSIVIGCSGNNLSREFQEAGADWTWQKPLPANGVIVDQIRKSMVNRNLCTAK